MVFTWDPRKSDANLQERGFDFAFASLIFGGATVETADRREAYGESRWVAIGMAEEFHLTVVYTDRFDARGQVTRRIISARRSNQREREAYRKALQRRDAWPRKGGPASPSRDD